MHDEPYRIRLRQTNIIVHELAAFDFTTARYRRQVSGGATHRIHLVFWYITGHHVVILPTTKSADAAAST